MKKVVEIGLFEAAEIWKNKIAVSHLQYADDTIFACPARVSNLVAIKQILRNFELVSGLKVNFNKCELMGLNVESQDIRNVAEYLQCKVSKNPLVYLGISVGVNHRL